MEVVHQIGIFENYDFEISMISGVKVTLDDCCRTGAIPGNDLPASPWRCYIVVLVEVVHQIATLWHNHFKITVAPAAKVTLDHAA